MIRVILDPKLILYRAMELLINIYNFAQTQEQIKKN